MTTDANTPEPEPKPAFPVGLSLGDVRIVVNADGSVMGDKKAWAKQLAEFKAPEGQYEPVALIVLAQLLNAPWRL